MINSRLKVRTNIPLMDDQLKITRTIAKFWDKTTNAWRVLWGPHIHHGYYEDDPLTPLQAQEKLIEKLLEFM